MQYISYNQEPEQPLVRIKDGIGLRRKAEPWYQTDLSLNIGSSTYEHSLTLFSHFSNVSTNFQGC